MASILYAEDEFTNRKLIEIQLQRANLNCDLACNGEEAWEMFQNGDYKLIILDRYMPKMNGDELARKIKQVRPDIPLIAITSDDSDVKQLREAGFSEIFIKPLHGREYITLIRQYLED
ncbi:response regulator [Salinispira pacifica]|uniref:DNA-binding response regulator CtrA n=1 Tax=Salinispira pacifica TaxID=1307761 RepID=V5WLA4_9SPIO|nr:response regulator [Salinispira pacifica]AHC16607.1 DNA-binding response regulator CtrA [Salinispira pacifica]